MYTAGTPYTCLPEKCLCAFVSMEMILPQLHWNVCNVHKEEEDPLEYLGSVFGPAVSPWLYDFDRMIQLTHLENNYIWDEPQYTSMYVRA